MNGTYRLLVAVVVPALLFSAAILARAEDSPALDKETETKLLAVLASDAPIFDKAKACQRLAVVGTKKAVPALAKLLSNKELARELHLSEATVKSHLIHVFNKLEVTDRTAAVTAAFGKGILRLDP